MTILDEWRLRVKGVLEVASELADVSGLIVVGGYAVSARTLPRLSFDLDVVIRNDTLDQMNKILKIRGFTKGRRFPNPEKTVVYGDETVRWSQKDSRATVDVMAGGLMDRHVKVWIPYEKVDDKVTKLPIPSPVTLSTGPVLPIASADTLIALKLQPLRPIDVADLVALVRSAGARGCAGRAAAMVTNKTASGLVANLLGRLGDSGDPCDFGTHFEIGKGDALREVDRARRFYREVMQEIDRT